MHQLEYFPWKYFLLLAEKTSKSSVHFHKIILPTGQSLWCMSLLHSPRSESESELSVFKISYSLSSLLETVASEKLSMPIFSASSTSLFCCININLNERTDPWSSIGTHINFDRWNFNFNVVNNIINDGIWFPFKGGGGGRGTFWEIFTELLSEFSFVWLFSGLIDSKRPGFFLWMGKWLESHHLLSYILLYHPQLETLYKYLFQNILKWNVPSIKQNWYLLVKQQPVLYLKSMILLTFCLDPFK